MNLDAVHLRFVGALNIAAADRGCVEDQPQRLAVDAEFDLHMIWTRCDWCSAHSRGPTNRRCTDLDEAVGKILDMKRIQSLEGVGLQETRLQCRQNSVPFQRRSDHK